VDITHKIGSDRGGYLYVIEGALAVEDHSLRTGDAAKIRHEGEFTLVARDPSELILVDVPMKLEPVGVWRNRW